MNRIRLPKKLSKTHIAFLLVTMGLVLLVVVAGYHEMSWQRYSDANDANYRKAKEWSEQLLSLDAPTVKSINETAEVLTTSSNELCGNTPFLASARAELFSATADEIAQCEQKKQVLTEVRDNLVDIESYLVVDGQLAEAFTRADSALKKVKQGDISGRKAVWESIERDISQIAPPNNVSVGSLATQQKAVKQVIDNYVALLEADKTQNRPSYNKAIEALKASYKQLRATTEGSKTEYTSMIVRLEESIQAL